MTHTHIVDLGIWQQVGLAALVLVCVAIFIWGGKDGGDPPAPTPPVLVEEFFIGFHKPKGARA